VRGTGSGAGTNGGAAAGSAGEGILDVPMYQIDALVRRAPSLQKTREGRTPAATY
jgi:NADH-quinone oxidoreductase subunit G